MVGIATSALGEPAYPPLVALELKRFGHFNGAINRNGTLSPETFRSRSSGASPS